MIFGGVAGASPLEGVMDGSARLTNPFLSL